MTDLKKNKNLQKNWNLGVHHLGPLGPGTPIEIQYFSSLTKIGFANWGSYQFPKIGSAN